MTVVAVVSIAFAVIALVVTFVGFGWAAREDGRYQKHYGDDVGRGRRTRPRGVRRGSSRD